MNDGLDLVEVVMEIEDCFDIQIPDVTAERFATWGDVHRYVVQGIGASDVETGRCLSRDSFHMVRAKLHEVLPAIAGGIRPSTRLEDLLPVAHRREMWQRLAVALGLPKYYLGLSPPIQAMLLAMLVAAFAAALGHPDWLGVVVLVASLAAIALLYVFLKVTCGNRIPEDVATVGQLVSWSMTRSIPELKAGRSTWTTNEVWQVIRHFVAASACVPVRKVTPQTRVATDLI